MCSARLAPPAGWGVGAGVPRAEGAGPHVGADFLRAYDDASRDVVVGWMDTGGWRSW
jgi:hypothetical protein